MRKSGFVCLVGLFLVGCSPQKTGRITGVDGQSISQVGAASSPIAIPGSKKFHLIKGGANASIRLENPNDVKTYGGTSVDFTGHFWITLAATSPDPEADRELGMLMIFQIKSENPAYAHWGGRAYVKLASGIPYDATFEIDGIKKPLDARMEFSIFISDTHSQKEGKPKDFYPRGNISTVSAHNLLVHHWAFDGTPAYQGEDITWPDYFRRRVEKHGDPVDPGEKGGPDVNDPFGEVILRDFEIKITSVIGFSRFHAFPFDQAKHEPHVKPDVYPHALQQRIDRRVIP